jgi:nucleoside-diphosphate-sugar epimerase
MLGKTVVITGAGGLLGRRLIAALEQDPEVERIVGTDLTPPRDLDGGKLTLERVDVQDRGIGATFAGADVVVHLAFQVDPIQDEPRMRAINVGGTRNVVERAHEAGVRKFVYVSSGMVYGAHPDNDFPLSEESPLRANAPFNYAEHKLEVEQWLWPWAQEHPDMVVTVLRPSIVAGPGVENFITRQMDAPLVAVVRGHKPPMQFAHVDDITTALTHAVRNDLPGAYNVTSEGWLSFDEIVAIGRRRVMDVPEEVAFSLVDQLWQMGVGEAPVGAVHYVMHPWVLSVERLLSTGWRPVHSNRDALAELAEEHADHLVVGPVRTSRTQVRRLAAAVAAASMLLVAWELNRRRTA